MDNNCLYRYLCYYCVFASPLQQCVDHMVESHGHLPLKVKLRSFDENTCLVGYTSRDFGFVPNNEIGIGQFLEADEGTCIVCIVQKTDETEEIADLEISLHNMSLDDDAKSSLSKNTDKSVTLGQYETEGIEDLEQSLHNLSLEFDTNYPQKTTEKLAPLIASEIEPLHNMSLDDDAKSPLSKNTDKSVPLGQCERESLHKDTVRLESEENVVKETEGIEDLEQSLHNLSLEFDTNYPQKNTGKSSPLIASEIEPLHKKTIWLGNEDKRGEEIEGIYALEISLHNMSLDFDAISPLSKKTKTSTPIRPNERESLRTVNTNENEEKDVEQIKLLVPNVVDEMKRTGNLQTWIDFHKMVHDEQFPLENIAFRLFMDVCRLYACDNTCEMKYSDTVKRFWRIGYKLFHGKWLKFIGDTKYPNIVEGIPDMPADAPAQETASQPPSGAPTTAATTATTPSGTTASAGGTVTVSAPTPEYGDDPLAFLRTQPQFHQMRRMHQESPQLLPQLLQQTGQSNPQLLLMIQQNQERFVSMLNEEQDEAQGGAGGGTPAGAGGAPGDNPGVDYINVTQQENESIYRSVSRVNMEQRYVAAMVLSGVGDAMGFKDGSWEFCMSGAEIHHELLALGGVANLKIQLPYWPVSDDTVMHIATAEGLVSAENVVDKDQLYPVIARHFVEGVKDMAGRSPGMTTMDSVRRLRPDMEGGCRIPFYGRGGGCGAAMRAMCIGLRYPLAQNETDLVAVSIESGRMTHHHPTGYLGSLASALFTAYAVRGKPLREWGRGLLETLPNAWEYIKTSGHYVKENEAAWDSFGSAWRRYVKDRTIVDGSTDPTFPDSYDVQDRDEFYERISHSGWGGASGYDAPMIAYDALLGSNGNWEELCKRGMFHGGDSDSTGVIAGACYGAMFGFHGVPEGNYQELEYRKKLEKIGIELYRLSGAGQNDRQHPSGDLETLV